MPGGGGGGGAPLRPGGGGGAATTAVSEFSMESASLLSVGYYIIKVK